MDGVGTGADVDRLRSLTHHHVMASEFGPVTSMLRSAAS
jgi:hypothetical protein